MALTCASMIRSFSCCCCSASATCAPCEAETASEARSSCCCGAPPSSMDAPLEASALLTMPATILLAIFLNCGFAIMDVIISFNEGIGGGGALLTVPTVKDALLGLARILSMSRSPSASSSPSTLTTVSPSCRTPSEAARPFSTVMILSRLHATPKPSGPRCMTTRRTGSFASSIHVDACDDSDERHASITQPYCMKRELPRCSSCV